MTPWKHPVLLGAIIVVTTLAVYRPVGDAGFLWDDDSLVYRSALNQAPDGLVQIWFSTKPFDYFPLTYTAFWLEWRLWGEYPTGYYAVNVLLHSLASILIWRVMAQLRVPGAWFVGLLFAIHPVNAASVAWISEQKNTLSLVLVAASALFYLKYDAGRQRHWYALALTTFILALLSKTSVVMLPVVMLGYVWWRRGHVAWSDIRPTLPFFVASAVLSVVTIYFQYTRSIGIDDIGSVRPEGLLSRLAASGWVVWFYLYKAFWPFNLAVIYPRWDVDPASPLHWLPLAAMLAALFVLARLNHTSARGAMIALGTFVVLLFPVLGFISMAFARFSLVADHLQYFPLVAPVALAAGTAAWGLSRLSANAQRIGLAAGCAFAIGLAAVTHQRVKHFESMHTLMADNLLRYPDVWPCQFLLGAQFSENGQPREAIPHYEQAITLNPRYVEARHNLAGCYFDTGQYGLALEHYQTVATLKPTLAMAFHGQARSLSRMGRTDDAIHRYRKSLQIDPDLVRAHVNLGLLLTQRKDYGQANQHFQRALSISPNNAEVNFFVGGAYFNQRRYPQAITRLRHTLKLRPDYPEAQHILDRALARINKRSISK